MTFDKSKLASHVDVFVDYDTFVIRAATSVQHNYSIYKEGEFIQSAQSIKNWVETNPELNKDAYEFIQEPRLIKTEDGSPVEWRAMAQVKYSSNAIRNHIHNQFGDINTTIWWCVHGEGNYRLDIYPDYKAKRTTEILMKKVVSDYAKKKLPNVIIANGEETDDVVAKYCFKGYRDYLSTGKYTTCCVALDKDLETVAGLHLHPEAGELYEISHFDAFKFFCQQLLQGDMSTDNIKGINGAPPPEVWDQWKEIDPTLRRSSKGIGEVTAKKLVDMSPDMESLLQRVTEAYKEVHGDNWLTAMQEEAVALRMRHRVGEKYNIADTLLKCGVITGDEWQECENWNKLGENND